MIPRFAVIATHNRPDELARAVLALDAQCGLIVVIDNASDPPVSEQTLDDAAKDADIVVLRDIEQPPNLSRLWNVGLDFVADIAQSNRAQPWDVAIVNDDAVPPAGWFDAVSGAMRSHGAAAGSSQPFDHPGVTLHREDAPCAVETRLTGWAFVLRGELGLRCDERLRWWYQDDLLSLRARQQGGLVHVGGYPVPNTGANTSTVGVLAEQAGKDRAMFVEITGLQPW